MKEEKESLNFEETMHQLELIVQELENGDLNLDDSIKKFEQGMKLSKNASDYLEEAEKKITKLVKQDNQETLKEEEF
ncbi:MAG: exodeoxyribonuclease VII small subunit [Clostridia bacterium]|nr:exodeoxyribonuclease VII small subunit [Clostridia bacterium]